MELACCDGVDVFPHLNKRSILQQQKFAGITCYDANEIDCFYEICSRHGNGYLFVTL